MRVEVQPLTGFDQLLTYKVSEKISSKIKIGCLVQIPLGHRQVLGVVFSLDSKEMIDPEKLRFLGGLIQPEPVLSLDLIRLSKWVCNYYSCSMESVLAAMIPTVVREGKKAKNEKWIQLHPQKTKGDKLKSAPKQRELFCKLNEIGKPIRKTQLTKEWGYSLNTINGLITKGMVYEVSEIVHREVYDDELDNDVVESEWELTTEQKKATSELEDLLHTQKFGVQLLHGVTGSGKTEVYFEAMEVALDQGGGVLFLVPEVSLAPQTVARLRARFSKRNEKVEVWHSNLSGGERLDAWRNLSTGKSRIVVGARSAVFAPIPSLRLIVVDEEHE
ncbi:MAG: DEAD/DEAH box helicase, partial [Verrucomicrobiota bacterium]|nr:DEAD/DEAH box helicase [Verrucomicrobiota bacterium]